MSLRLALAAALLAWPAAAQEAIATGPEAARAPAVREDPRSPEAIGRWARGVLAGQPAETAEAARPKGRCTPPPDRKPHGEVWAGIGTGGYRQVGGVLTAPIGDCGRVTIAVDKMETDGPKRR